MSCGMVPQHAHTQTLIYLTTAASHVPAVSLTYRTQKNSDLQRTICQT